MFIRSEFLVLVLLVLCMLVVSRCSTKLFVKATYSRADLSYNYADLWRVSILVLMLFAATAISIDIALQVLGHRNELSSLYFAKFLHGIAGQDSWGVMVKALMHLDTLSDESIYEALILKDHTKFQYPPSALLVFDLPRRMFGFTYDELLVKANIVSWACLPLSVITFYLIFKRSLNGLSQSKESDSATSNWALILATLSISVVVVAMFYPLLRSYYLGQIQTSMTLLAGLSILAWQLKRFGTAGVFLSICCSIKPQWIILLPWALFRRQWRFVISFVSSYSVIFFLTTALYGVKNWLDYFPVLSYLSKYGESFFPNQSLNGVLHRFLFNGNNLEWLGNAFPPYNPWVHAITLVSSLLILAFALFWRWKAKPTYVDLSIIVVSLTVASPIAWEHHFAVCLFIFAFLIPLTVVYRPLGRWSMIYLGFIFLIVSQNYGVLAAPLANTKWNVLQSTLYLGVMMLLHFMYVLSKKHHERLFVDKYTV